MRRLRGSAPSGIPGRGGGLFSLRRLRRSACGAFFACLYVDLGLIFYAQAVGILAWCHFGLSQGLSLASRGPLLYAQAAWIRVRYFFYDCIYIGGFYFVRRLRGSVPGVILAPPRTSPAASWCRCGGIFLHRLQRSVSANTRS